ESTIKRAKVKALAKEGAAASMDQVTLGADERNRWLKEAYREAPLPNRPRNALGILHDIPPEEKEAMLYASTTDDDDAMLLLANNRAQATKDAIAAKGIAGERLFLTAPSVTRTAGSGEAAGNLMRVDLKLG